MNTEIKKWFDEAKAHSLLYQTHDCNFLIYKGFKITESKDGLELLDVRLSNTYSKVSDSCLKKIRQHGFVKGVDILGFERDTKRITCYTKRVAGLVDKLSRYEIDYENNKKLNEKRIRNTKIKIEDYLDLVAFYKTRIKQFNLKYNMT